jgi:hypothetical protein
MTLSIKTLSLATLSIIIDIKRHSAQHPQHNGSVSMLSVVEAVCHLC